MPCDSRIVSMVPGRSRPIHRNTLHKPPTMKHSTSLFTLSCMLLPWSLLAAPQDLRDFDSFIHHVRQETTSGDPERIADCFAPFVVTEVGCEPEAFGDALASDALRFGWKQVGRDIARFADGFVLVDVDGTMTNLHARAAGQPHFLDILGDRVKLRREAGAGGAIIAMLDLGTLPGSIDPTRWTVTRDEVQWTPVVVEVPDMGQVRGYIGADYVRQSTSTGDLKLTADYDGTRWALTGYERIRPELAVKGGGSTP